MIRMVLTSALMLLVFTSTAFSQYYFDFKGTGTRAQGMGNAFIAVSDDASAPSWNPAGLTVHEKLLMGFDFDSYTPDNKFETGLASYGSNPNFGSVSQLSVIAPFRFRGSPMVLGLSFSSVFQEFWNDGANATIPYVNSALGAIRDSSVVDYSSASAEHPNLKVINIALGTKLKPNLSAGISINVYTGENVVNGLVDQVIPHFTEDNVYPQYVKYENLLKINDTAKYSGANFTIGFKYDMDDKTQLGLTIRTPFHLQEENDFKFKYQTLYNDLLQDVGSDTIYVDNKVVKYGIPLMLGFGAATHPSENLLFAADFEYRAFSGEDVQARDSIHIKPGTSNEEFYSVYDLNNDNSTTFRVGAEYLWHTGMESFPVIPLRIGFSTVSLPSTSLGLIWVESENSEEVIKAVPSPVMIESASINRFHLGLGIKWSQIYLDAAVTFSSVKLPLVVDENVEGVEGTYTAGDWDNSTTNFSFGFTGYF